MRRVAVAVMLAAVAAGSFACRRTEREPFVAYLNADFRLSIAYPASWRSEQAQQEGMWYRYFLGPTTGPQRKPAVSATLLAGPLRGTIDDYAQAYLAGNKVSATREERRPGLAGKSYVFTTPDGATRYALLLLKEDASDAGGAPRVIGLYCQGDATSYAQYAAALDEMAASLTIERPQDWPEIRVPEAALALRVPGSWRHLRRTSGGGVRLEQFTSPVLAIDEGRETVHASLTVSIEPAPHGLGGYYSEVKQKLGPNFGLVTHTDWRDGYVDVLHVETPMASSWIRRFYCVSGSTGYSLIFEARSDVYQRALPWFDLIADTLRVGPEAAGR